MIIIRPDISNGLLKRHRGLFWAYLVRSYVSLSFGIILLADRPLGWLSVVGAVVCFTASVFKSYGALFEYRVVRLGGAIGMAMSVMLFLTVVTGVRPMSFWFLNTLWLQYIISQGLIMAEPPSNPSSMKD